MKLCGAFIFFYGYSIFQSFKLNLWRLGDDSISQVQRGMQEELKAVQSHVMDLILEELPDDVDEDLAKDEAFHSLYASKAAKLVVIDKKPSSATTPPEVASSSVSIQHHLNIPMPTFDGLYEHWPTFKAMFLDIMKRTNDSDAVKLHHLNKALQGKAADNRTLITDQKFFLTANQRRCSLRFVLVSNFLFNLKHCC